MFVAWQGPSKIMFFFSKNTPSDGIARVDSPCVEQVFCHALKNACYRLKRKLIDQNPYKMCKK